jgi:hypothetical protein
MAASASVDLRYLDVFKPTLLATEDDVELALQVAANIDPSLRSSLLRTALSINYALEFLLSGVSLDQIVKSGLKLIRIAAFDEDVFHTFLEEMLSWYPPPTDFATSLPIVLLERLLETLVSVQGIVSSNEADVFRSHARGLEHVKHVLSAAASNQIDDILSGQVDMRRAQSLSFARRERTKPHSRFEPSEEQIHLDAALTALGHQIPKSRSGLNKIVHCLLDFNKSCLLVCNEMMNTTCSELKFNSGVSTFYPTGLCGKAVETALFTGFHPGRDFLLI